MNKEKADSYYYVCIVLAKHEYFALWHGNSSGPDEFVLVPGASNVLFGMSPKELEKAVRPIGLRISNQPPWVVDLDKMFRRLMTIRPERQCSIDTCESILSGWNVLEDLVRSIRPGEHARGKEAKSLKKIYKKLFFGNNLPSVTPIDKIYRPTFTSEERIAMRKYFVILVNEINFPKMPLNEYKKG